MQSFRERTESLLIISALSTACGGGTQAVLEQQLAADKARQEARAAAEAEEAAARQGSRDAALAAVPGVVSAHLGVSADVVSTWEIHVTPASTAAVVRDPSAALCSVVLLLGREPHVYATGRPLGPLPDGVLTTPGGDGPVGWAALLSDEHDLKQWTAEHCAG